MARGRSLRTMAYMRASSPRFRFLALLVALVVPALAAGPAVAADRSVATPSSARPAVRRVSRARTAASSPTPHTPGDDDAAALAALGADGLAGGRPRRRAARAGRGDGRRRGRRRPRRGARHPRGHAAARPPYSGIPLLNWNAPAKVKTVPAGGTVDVREVRFPGHAERCLAAALRGPVAALHRALPRQPARRRRRRRAAAGPAAGRRADRFGAVPATLDPLLPPDLATGTFDANRFTPSAACPARPEASRLAEQVDRGAHARARPDAGDPPAEHAAGHAVPLHPRAGHRCARGRRGRRLRLLRRRPDAPPSARRRSSGSRPRRPSASCGTTSARSPPASRASSTTPAASARRTASSSTRMRTRDALPAGTGAVADADLTVVLENGETYVSRTSLRPAAGRVRVTVVNATASPTPSPPSRSTTAPRCCPATTGAASPGRRCPAATSRPARRRR